MKSKIGGKKGFTVIEVVVMLMIIGILALVAYPAFIENQEKEKPAITEQYEELDDIDAMTKQVQEMTKQVQEMREELENIPDPEQQTEKKGKRKDIGVY